MQGSNYKQYQKSACEECGATNGFYVGDYWVKRKILTVHHIDHNHFNDDPNNLVTLCRKCHQSKHTPELEKKYELKKLSNNES